MAGLGNGHRRRPWENDRDGLAACREELSRLHMNLTSVLANPRDPHGLDFASSPSGNPFDNIAAFFAGNERSPQPVPPLQTASGEQLAGEDDFEELRAYLARIGPAYSFFAAEHNYNPRRSPQRKPRRRNSFRSSPGGGTVAAAGPGTVAAAAAAPNPLRCFDEVPSIYFGEHFSLEDPSTFAKCVLEASREEQEALTEHLDSVEGALLQQIKDRSNRFFEALDTLEVVRGQVRSAGESVLTLRRRIAKLQRDITMQSGRIPKLQRSRKNCEALTALMGRCMQVMHTRESIQVLLDNREFGAALDVIANAQDVLNGDLVKVHALKPFQKQLIKYKEAVAQELVRMFIAQTLTLTMEDVEREHKGDLDVDEGGECSAGPSLQEIWQGLRRCKCVELAISRFHERLQMELKVVLRTVVVEYVQSEEFQGGAGMPDADDGTVVTPKRMHALSPEAFKDCLDAAFEALLTVLTRCQTVIAYSERHLDGHAAANGGAIGGDAAAATGTTEGGASVARALKESLKNGCELAQRSIVSLILMRKEQNFCLALEDLKALWDTVMRFIMQVEKLAGVTGYELRGTLLSQAKGFLEKKVQVQKASLVSTLDAERWVRADVTPERQAALERLVSGHAFLRVADLAKSESPLAGSPVSSNAGSPTAANGDAHTGRKRREDVVLGGRRFKVVWSVLLLLEMSTDLLSILAIFPALVVDVLQRLLELVKLYNTRSYHLVLLGEATQSAAKLTSIRAKHLALSSQSLHLVTHVLPHVRAALLGHLPQQRRALLSQLDKVTQEVSEHHTSILSKLVSMVFDVFQAHRDTLRARNWDTASNQSNPNLFLNYGLEANRNMRGVLAKVLPPEQTQEVLTRVSDAVIRLVRESLASTFPETEGGRKNLVGDVQLMVTSLMRENPKADHGAMQSLLSEVAERYDISLNA